VRDRSPPPHSRPFGVCNMSRGRRDGNAMRERFLHLARSARRRAAANHRRRSYAFSHRFHFIAPVSPRSDRRRQPNGLLWRRTLGATLSRAIEQRIQRVERSRGGCFEAHPGRMCNSVRPATASTATPGAPNRDRHVPDVSHREGHAFHDSGRRLRRRHPAVGRAHVHSVQRRRAARKPGRHPPSRRHHDPLHEHPHFHGRHGPVPKRHGRSDDSWHCRLRGPDEQLHVFRLDRLRLPRSAGPLRLADAKTLVRESGE
jgi:hypothetical protein